MDDRATSACLFKPSPPSPASGVMALLIRRVILGLLGSLRMVAEGSSSGTGLRAPEKELGCFQFPGPLGAQGQIETGSLQGRC